MLCVVAALAGACSSFGPGDRFDVVVQDVPEFSGTVTVDADGNIHIPIVGDVPVRGCSAKSVATTIERRLQIYVKRPVVRIAPPRPVPVFWVAKASASNLSTRVETWPLPTGPMSAYTLLDVIVMAGAPLGEGALTIVRFADSGAAEERVVPLAEIWRSRRHPVVKPGDFIILPAGEKPDERNPRPSANLAADALLRGNPDRRAGPAFD